MTTPDIVIYTRHSAGCKYEADETARRCTCRKWLRWSQSGKQIRRPANTRSWQDAERVKRDIEDQLSGNAPAVTQEKPLADAIDLFKTDKRVQGVTDDVLGKYARELRRLQDFAERSGVFTVSGLSRETLVKYQSTWSRMYGSGNTRQMVRARLVGFLRFCYDSGWIPRVPKLSTVQADERPTMPLTTAEFLKLLETVPMSFPETIAVKTTKYREHSRAAMGGGTKQRRVRALVLLMRHSGLAIMDAATLRRDELLYDYEKDIYRVVTNRQKTGTHVSVPLPGFVAAELLALPIREGKAKPYFFWTGEGKPQSAVTHWQDDFRKLFKDAGIEAGGMMSHRLRDTFAVEMLRVGIPLEEVSKMLGHTSIKTTEKHYAKWVKARQDRLDDLVTATWTTTAAEARPN